MDETRSAKILQATRDMYFVLDRDGTILDFKPSIDLKPLLPPEQFLKRRLTEVMPGEVAEGALERIRSVLEGSGECFLEYPLEVGGHRRHFEARFSQLGGEVLAIVRDVTEKRLVESTYRALLNASEDMAMLLYRDGRIGLINEKAARFYGATPEDMRGKMYWDYLPPDRTGLRRERLQRLLAGKHPSQLIDVSSEKVFEVSSNPLTEDSGTVNQVALFIRDITEKVTADQELVESEARYRRLFQDNPVPMYIYDMNSLMILDVNGAMVDRYGYAREEFTRMTMMDLRPPEDAEELKKHLLDLRDGRIYSGMWRHRTKDGSLLEVETTSSDFPMGNRNARIVVCQDVTEKNRIQEALRASELRFRTVFRSSLMNIALNRLEDGCFVDVSEGFLHESGYSREEILGRAGAEVDFWLDDEERSAFFREIANTGKVHNMEARLRHGDGTARTGLISSMVIDIEGVPHVLTVTKDITDLKETEKALRESEEKFRTAFLTSPDSVNINRLQDGLYIDINEGFSKISGYRRDEVIGKTSLELDIWVNTRDRERLVEGLGRDGYVENLEASFRMKDGRILQGLMSAKILTLQGVPHILSITRDITELKNAQASLTESEEKFRTVFMSSPDAMNITEMDTGLQVDVNESFCRLIGYELDELIGRRPVELGLWEQPRERERIVAELAGGEVVDNREVIVRTKGGQRKVVLFSARVMLLQGKAHMLAMARDITDYKEAQQALTESEERFRTIFHTSPDSIVLCRLEDGEYVNVSDGFTSVTGYSREEVLGSTGADIRIWCDSKDRERFFRQLKEKGHVNNFESHFKRRDGSTFPGLISAAVVVLKGESHLLAILRDVSELSAVQEQLKASLEEKEVLLKEIHHRVKNNLQVISGLLNLQAHHITDEKGKAIYKESQNRVITMALIHEDLYQSSDLARVNFADYIRNLGENLMISYGVKKKRIRLAVDAQDLDLVEDTAKPCGLIINELVTNALKHAFPSGGKGKISLTFRSLQEDLFQLVVSDDGVGLPEDLDLANTKTLGMRLVSVLAEQLGGKLEIIRGEGTTFRITFREYHEAGSVLY
ncbi:MAG: PAS domain S-box protein [bacterium]|nr:MAG: PAS domain S-box protein [bacterium]